MSYHCKHGMVWRVCVLDWVDLRLVFEVGLRFWFTYSWCTNSKREREREKERVSYSVVVSLRNAVHTKSSMTLNFLHHLQLMIRTTKWTFQESRCSTNHVRIEYCAKSSRNTSNDEQQLPTFTKCLLFTLSSIFVCLSLSLSFFSVEVILDFLFLPSTKRTNSRQHIVCVICWWWNQWVMLFVLTQNF